MILILGAGLAGLSASYHLKHEQCLLLERDLNAYGHAASVQRDGFTWDHGPHVSFTKSIYVRELFEKSVNGNYQEIEVQVGNYFHGNWIAHPAQTSLHQVPEPIRTECLKSFLSTRSNSINMDMISNYKQWLETAFGPVFANTFANVYTQKYWTRQAESLSTEWIGDRIHYPDVADVVRGAKEPLGQSMHYINRVRYPSHGGYQAFAQMLREGAEVKFGAHVVDIDLKNQAVFTANGQEYSYDKLINTLPLPVFVGACRGAPEYVLNAARRLSCSQLLLVNVAVPHQAQRPENWVYVYDANKFATRINFVEKMSPHNAPAGWTGIQVEVYFSRHRPLTESPEVVAERIEQELIEMGLIKLNCIQETQKTHRHISYSAWANIIFDHDTKPALEIIWDWLETYGLKRERDDTHPLTDWGSLNVDHCETQRLFMAGRFGQWKYFWSDDCVLRGKQIAETIYK